jgi:hypothetical protein
MSLPGIIFVLDTYIWVDMYIGTCSCSCIACVYPYIHTYIHTYCSFIIDGGGK